MLHDGVIKRARQLGDKTKVSKSIPMKLADNYYKKMKKLKGYIFIGSVYVEIPS